jgi:hypothetical protein
MSSKMKNYTWEKIRDIYSAAVDAEDNAWVNWDESVIAEEISKVPKKYRPGLAAAFSVVKWDESNPNRGQGPCGLCVFYDMNHVTCESCPLMKKDKGCNEAGSLFDQADVGYDGTFDKKAANKLYKVLCEIYKEEWEKI